MFLYWTKFAVCVKIRIGKSGERETWGVLGDAGDDILGQMEVVLGLLWLRKHFLGFCLEGLTRTEMLFFNVMILAGDNEALYYLEIYSSMTNTPANKTNLSNLNSYVEMYLFVFIYL